jgi:hypothetical protein
VPAANAIHRGPNSDTGWPGAPLARLAKPSTVGTWRDFHGLPNAASRREMRQLLVGNSITLRIVGPLVAVAAGGSGVSCGGGPVLDGVGGVQAPKPITQV